MNEETSNLSCIGRYSAREVARLAGVSSRRIGSWARYGIIPSEGRRPNIYSYADAGEAVVAHYLTDNGVPPSAVRDLVRRLRRDYGPWPLSAAPLARDGVLVVLRGPDGTMADVVDRVDHLVVPETFLALEDIRDALAHGGWVALRTRRPHIEVDPDRLSGRPTVRGRRVPTTLVAGIARAADGRETLRDELSLSDDEIDGAVAYENDVEKAIAA